MSAVLRRRIDVVSVLAAVGSVGYLVACCLAGAPAVLLLPVPLLANWVHLVEHNHAHVPVFKGRNANELFSWVLTLGTAIPVEGYRYHHLEVHHRYAGTPQDWTSPFAYRGATFPDRPVRLAWYVLTYMPRAWRRGIPTMWRRRSTQQGRRFWRSVAVLGASAAMLGVAQPRAFLLFFVLPWLGHALVPALTNWRHHRGCDHASWFTAANVNLGPFSRSLGFNIGYHSAHHAYPGLHWSRLPRTFAEEFAPFTPPERLIGATPKRLARLGID